MDVDLPAPDFKTPSTAAKFVKRPIVVEALHWTYSPWPVSMYDLKLWGVRARDEDGMLWIWVAPEDFYAPVPDRHWIIKGVAGEFYPCAPDIFEATYEPVTLTEAAVVYRDRLALREVTHLQMRLKSVLDRVFDFLRHRDEMNAAVHESDVRYSPLTNSVAAAVEYVERLRDWV